MNRAHIVSGNKKPSSFGQPILLMQSVYSRAMNVGYLNGDEFVPGRLNLGAFREECAYQATIESLKLSEVQQILKKYEPKNISTITLLREAIAHRLGSALYKAGINNHYGDSFIGVTHNKKGSEIVSDYFYENIEGLVEGGLWVMADSICLGRNLLKSLHSLFSKMKPKEILFISSIASREGIELIGKLLSEHTIPTTFVAWGALFGVDERTRYDMPWGHNYTEPLDMRDQEVFINMYGKTLCVGGDFGNDYYCPPQAITLYQEQLKEHNISPQFPTKEELLSKYSPQELLII